MQSDELQELVKKCPVYQKYVPNDKQPSNTTTSKLNECMYEGITSYESASNALVHIDSCLSKIIEKENDDCEPKSKISKRQNSLYQGVAFESWINNHIYPLFDVKCNKEEVQLLQCIPENLDPNQKACLKSLIVSIEKGIEPIIPIIESLVLMEHDEL